MYKIKERDENMMDLKEKFYNLTPKVKVIYGIDIVNKFANIIKDLEGDKVFFITESTLFEIHGKYLYENMKAEGIEVELIILNGNESNKTFSNLEELCTTLINKRISKDSIIIGFGGGIVGNIAGFAAGIIFRGIRYVEIPTTFMGQTDSSLSNKQAVNGRNGKNQLGMYYAPILIWSDLKYIETENIDYIKAGIVEGLKNGLISDESFLELLYVKVENRDSYTIEELYELFELIVDSKNKILERDPSEKKYAVILEYGHTFGHAIEFLTKGKIIHGEAVAMGMCMAAELSYLMNQLSEEHLNLHYKILLPFMNSKKREFYLELDEYRIFHAIQNDNKRTKNGIKYVLLSKIGECLEGDGDYQIQVSEELVLKSIVEFNKKYLALISDNILCSV